jgi:UDP-N-acetylmuramoyl-tripeptide--D-alanyl-D-alanine ligase
MNSRKKPNRSNSAYAYAAAAKAEGAELLYFSPGAIAEGGIEGYIYQNGEWVRTFSRYPDAVYNASGFTERRREGVEYLYRAGIPFTSHSIGDKMNVYDNIKRFGKFADHLVPSEKVCSERALADALERCGDIVIKPSSGCRGTDVYRIGRGEAISDDIRRVLALEECVAQPYINSRTKAGQPYDFRLHTQKDGENRWQAYVYPRISSDGGIVCNLSRGGCTCDITDFLKSEFGGGYMDMQKYLEVFAVQLAEHMEEIQLELYGEMLDALGIDAGWDGKLYIYEINWRPGFPPYSDVSLTFIKNSIRYAVYLAERGKRRGR